MERHETGGGEHDRVALHRDRRGDELVERRDGVGGSVGDTHRGEHPLGDRGGGRGVEGPPGRARLDDRTVEHAVGRAGGRGGAEEMEDHPATRGLADRGDARGIAPERVDVGAHPRERRHDVVQPGIGDHAEVGAAVLAQIDEAERTEAVLHRHHDSTAGGEAGTVVGG